MCPVNAFLGLPPFSKESRRRNPPWNEVAGSRTDRNEIGKKVDVGSEDRADNDGRAEEERGREGAQVAIREGVCGTQGGEMHRRGPESERNAAVGYRCWAAAGSGRALSDVADEYNSGQSWDWDFNAEISRFESESSEGNQTAANSYKILRSVRDRT
ncbi:hypothetical protein K0M31_016464 [Melipona bicolor]|uniref:Uncharacterized protein n=1 Tax=Melipona bicolor TaxID=60889 RepID=A0AA40KTR6_9HYME|nr:hypothetical protein K0M31_016464 [Melipona bicolor]